MWNAHSKETTEIIGAAERIMTLPAKYVEEIRGTQPVTSDTNKLKCLWLRS
jgi:hypothetical protein